MKKPIRLISKKKLETLEAKVNARWEKKPVSSLGPFNVKIQGIVYPISVICLGKTPTGSYMFSGSCETLGLGATGDSPGKVARAILENIGFVLDKEPIDREAIKRGIEGARIKERNN